jgi:hypothetical protein
MMGGSIQWAAMIIMILLAGIAVFQVLLTFGFPLGEATMGGKYKILPKPLRCASAVSTIILLVMGLVYLQRANVISLNIAFLPTNPLVWFFTGYLGINTLANLASKSKKERLIMTPISAIACILGVFVATS